MATETTNGIPVETTANDEKSTNNVLLISSKRPRSFYERAAKELLASGVSTIKLSALGDAIAIAVELAAVLEQKKAVTILNIETKYQSFPRENGMPERTPGIFISLLKHPDFKGSRITPGHVTFSTSEGVTSIYEQRSSDPFASVNAGAQDLSVGGAGLNQEFAKVLTECGHEVDKFKEVHAAALKEAWKQNEGVTELSKVKLIELEDASTLYPGVKAVYCHVCPELKKEGKDTTGAVFVDIFEEEKRPHGCAQNCGMVYVVGPDGSDFSSKGDFLAAVTATACNVMTTMCDFNGMLKRSRAPNKLKRIQQLRVFMFSGGLFKHSAASKSDVANAILKGLNDGYHYGPSPRMTFAYDEDCFKQSWIEMTGLNPDTAGGDISPSPVTTSPTSA